MNLVYGLALHEFSVAQVDRGPARCLGGRRFQSCWGLRCFLCATLVTCWSFHFHKNQVIALALGIIIIIKIRRRIRIRLDIKYN